MIIQQILKIIVPPDSFHRKIIKRIMRFFPHIYWVIKYKSWLKDHNPTQGQIADLRMEAAGFPFQPCISIIMPVYNTEIKYLKAAIGSVRSQVYPNWELCIADDVSTNPAIKPYLEEIAREDSRIKVTFRDKNGHISRASNSAIELASGEFIGMLDHDDVLYPHALFQMVKLLNQNPKCDLIYSDSDVIVNNRRERPFFKPDWSPELFYNNNYLNHFTLMRKSLIDQIGGFRAGFEGSQDYDLYIRLIEKIDYANIAHISDVLYGWRAVAGSAALSLSNKDYAINAGFRALAESLIRRKIDGEIRPGLLGNMFQTHYKIRNDPLVSIIINIKGPSSHLQTCLDSIHKNTSYQNREIIIIGESNQSLNVNDGIKYIAHSASQNKSQMVNSAVQQADGQFLLFLNDDVETITQNWLTYFIEQAQREEIGIVGPKIMIADRNIYSAGIVLGIEKSVYAHSYHMLMDRRYYYSNSVNNHLALSGLCFMVEKSKFQKAGGYDAQFGPYFNHVDLCLKLIDLGYRHVFLPYVKVDTQKPQKDAFTEVELKYFQDKWHKFLNLDPYYSPNFTNKKADYKY
jgi:glycosyltransferase involved in cell wall biosynthesis